MALTAQQEAWLAEGITLFNEGHHWHAHEAWESLWKSVDGPAKRFIQGLIMAAALMVHYGRRNPEGVRKHWRNVQDRLEGVASHWGVDAPGLLAALGPYVRTAAAGPDAMDLPMNGVQLERTRRA